MVIGHANTGEPRGGAIKSLLTSFLIFFSKKMKIGVYK